MKQRHKIFITTLVLWGMLTGAVLIGSKNLWQAMIVATVTMGAVLLVSAIGAALLVWVGNND